MPPRTLLSSEQRTRLFSIPTDPAEMTRHYVLDADDLALVGARRRAGNRLGFAVQLCALRHPGGVPDPSEPPPVPMLAFVARQIGVDPALFGEYARRAETRREHLLELQRLLRLRSFGFADWRACLRIGADAAWATDRGEPIVQAMLAHLRANGVLLPAAAVLERIGLAARARARRKTFETLAAGLSDSERDTLTGLLAADPELRRSRFAWLRDYSESPAPSNIVALLDRLEYARGLKIDPGRAGRIHAARLARLIDEGAIMTVQHIADLEPARRTAILAVQAASLETRLSDATLAMFEKYMGTLFSRARNRDERRFQATRRDVARALILFRRTIAALRLAKETGEDGVAVVEREIGMEQLDGVLPVIGAVADVADQDILVTAAERYSVLRRFSPRFLAAFDFRSNTPNDPVLAAVELLRAMDRDGTRALPKRPPSSFLPPQWRRLIFANGAADRRLYETAVLATLRERLRGSNIWVTGSRDYRAFEDYLLPVEAGIPAREGRNVKHLVHMERGKRHLAGAHEVEVILGQVIDLRAMGTEEAGALHGRGLHQRWRDDGDEARVDCLRDGHVHEGELEQGADTGEEVEARATDLGPALGVDRAEDLADLEVIAYREVVLARSTDGLEHDEVVLAADRRPRLHDVRKAQLQCVDGGVGIRLSHLRKLHLRREGRCLRQQCCLLIALRKRDFLADGLLLVAHRVEAHDGRTAFLVGGQELVDERRVLTPGTL